jgi:hypothetical protein
MIQWKSFRQVSVWAFATIAAVAVSVLATQAQLTFSSPLNISHNAGGGPQLYVDRSGNIDALWLQNPAGASVPDVFFSRSTNNGASFSTPVDVSSGVSAIIREWPVVGVDSSGRIDIAWLNEYQTASGAPLVVDVYFTQSTNGGTSFSLAQNISLDGEGGPAAQFNYTVEPDGHIDVTWPDDSSGSSQIYFTHSIDGGATFSAPRNISNAPTGTNGSGGAILPFTAVDSAGNINVIWTQGPVTPPYSGKNDVFFTRSADNGATFGNSQNVTNTANVSGESGGSFQLSLDSAGDIDVFWASAPGAGFVTQSKDQGATFSASNPLPNAFNRIAVEPGGNIDVFSVQSQIVSGSPFNGTAVYQDTGSFSRSTDGGVTFSTPQTVATGYHNSTSQGSMQANMMVDATGAIDIAIAIGSSASGNPADLHVLRSTDNGATFTTTNVSNDGGYMTFYIYTPTIAADSSGNASVAWEDATQSDNILFSRGVNPNPPAPAIRSLSLSTSSVNAPGVLQGTVTLTQPAPKGNAKVTISSSNLHALAGPPQVVVHAGQTQAQFVIVALPTSSQITVTISAAYDGTNGSAPLTINPFRLVSHEVFRKLQ